jgi:hypothetical protein
VWAYGPTDQLAKADINHADLWELSRILASTAKPMNPAKQRAEDPCQWHGEEGDIDLSLRNFPRKEDLAELPVETLDSTDKRPFVDGVATKTTVEYFKQYGVGDKTATTIAANIAAGCMADTARIFEPAVMARTAQICFQSGFQVGSMGDHHRSRVNTRPCEACGMKTMVGWSINEETPNDRKKYRGTMGTLRQLRLNRILYSELDAWREAGLGHQPPNTNRAARQQAQTRTAEAKIAADRRQSIEERDARLEARKGQASTPTPTSEPAYDDRHGPRQFTEFVRKSVFETPNMLVCLNCAGPTILDIANHRTRGEKKWSEATALWQELVLIAQGQPTALPIRKINEGEWPKDRADLFQRGCRGELKGQTVRSEDGQTGKVVLVSPKTAGGELPTQAYVYWNSKPPELVLMDIEAVQAACTRAKEERIRHAEELLEKAMISLEEIQTAHPDEELVQIENAVATCYTISRNELFNGPRATENEHRKYPVVTKWTKNADGTIMSRRTKIDKHLAIMAAQDTERARILQLAHHARRRET